VPGHAEQLTHAGDGSESNQPEDTVGNAATILFVEDEAHQLSLMQKHLAAEGHRVLTAKDGAEAVQAYLRHRQEIDLVVLDLGLPKLNGWEAYKMMKEADPT
jgi:DNA-binding response OmpR family regulator